MAASKGEREDIFSLGAMAVSGPELVSLWPTCHHQIP
jgi:hypothetical protein